MAINQNRPVISYENIALLQSDVSAYSEPSNSGANISFLPLVQSIDISVDFQRNNAGQIGSKNFANQSFQNAPDVNLTINTFEDFGNLFSCLFTSNVIGNIIREDLDSDRNFYAILGDKRSFDVKNIDMDNKQIISLGNCFISSVSISQSINGLIQSNYNFTCSNLQAQTLTFNSEFYTGENPAINLNGATQSQDLKFYFLDLDSNYYTDNDKVIPYYDTNVLISGSGSFGNFLMNSESIQSFDLNLPINRKTVYSLGKKYPVKRKALFPSEGSFSFTNKTDDFYVNGERANLNDFLNYDEFYTIFISGSTRTYEDFVYQIQSGKLNSMNLSNSIGSNTENSLSFSFEVNNSSIDFSFIKQLGFNIDGEAADDRSGHSVSMNAAGDRVAIGAPYNDENGTTSGHTRIYEWNGSSWTQLGQDIDGEAAYDYSSWTVSMNSTGNRVAIGAIGNDGVNGNDYGHTRIYEWNGSSWIQLGFDIDGEADQDQSGRSVSMNSAGDRVAIGAVSNDANGSNSGHTRIYEWRQYTANDVGLYHYTSRVQNNTTQLLPLIITENFTTAPVVGEYYWTQLGLDIDGEAIGDNSGNSVSMNSAGDRVAIGAVLNDGSGFINSGHTQIYEWDGSSWTQLGSDIDGEADYDRTGYSVSMNAAGNRVAIGAPFRFNEEEGAVGYTRIYQWDGLSWTQLGFDIYGEQDLDYSGWSVSINSAGDRVAIGAYLNSDQGGHTRIYQWRQYTAKDVGLYHHTSSAQYNVQTLPLIITENFSTAPVVGEYYWTQLGYDINTVDGQDQNGYSVSMNSAGDRVAIGARFNDGGGEDSGHVRIYQLSNRL